MKQIKLTTSALVFAGLVSPLLIPIAQASIAGQATTPVGSSYTSAWAGDQIFGGLNGPGEAINGGTSSQYVTCNTETPP